MKHIVYSFFLILIVIFFAYVNSMHSVESFTPNIREFYRPIIRNTRLISEGFYNNTTSSVSNILRKLKII
jgi:hypothetical protein